MKTTFMSFANQKGGCGKSTFTTALASFIHYQTKLNVVVVDADFPQYSILSNRQRDIELVNSVDYYKQLSINQFRITKKKAYPILKSTPDTAIQVAMDYLVQNEHCHLVLFDLPGTVQSQGVLTTLSCMDYVFIPIIADRLVLESSLSFATTLEKAFRQNKDIRLRGIYLFWNQFDAREKNALYSAYSEIIKKLDLILLSYYIVDTKRFRKETILGKRMIFRSTLFPSSRRFLQESHLEDTILEIVKIILS